MHSTDVRAERTGLGWRQRMSNETLSTSVAPVAKPIRVAYALSRSSGNVRALDHGDFGNQPGEAVARIGDNGTGNPRTATAQHHKHRAARQGSNRNVIHTSPGIPSVSCTHTPVARAPRTKGGGTT